MRVGVVLAGVVVATTLGVAVAASPAAVPAGNLLRNPGAEAGSAGTNAVVPIPEWTVTGNFTVDGYANGDDLGPDVSAAVGGGANYFYGGPSNDTSSAAQVVDVSAAAAEIDAGTVPVSVGGQLGGYSSQGDSLRLVAEFLDASEGSLGALAVDGPSEADRNGESKLVARSASGTAPAGTRSIRVTMTSTRTAGSDDDGLADNLFLTLGAPSPAGGGPGTIGSSAPLPPPKPGVAVNVRTGTGTTLVRLPGRSGFAKLQGGDQIPVGATVDVSRGSVTLASSGGSARFSGGVFEVAEPAAPGSARVTQLTLTGGSFGGCPKKAKRRTAGVAAAPGKVIRQLLGSGKGRFRTRGRFASATVRGTIWLVQDRCDGTLVRVRRGRVVVADPKRHRTVLVTSGHSVLVRR